ncbi:MAG: efflux RND transporter periplasmic adaptor subunit [Gemmatimonadetes bacterium]|nr:efflux RND transporter periplasmic adaptor subunit [Gemmatimonadota bacterium]
MSRQSAAFAASSWILPVLLVAGCSRSPDPDDTATASDSTGVITLPADQVARIHVTPVADTTFHLTVMTTGTVAFDGNQSTQVLAPISGPVQRVLAEPGTHVAQGQPLAVVSSPDFAAAVADFRKAQAEAQNARRIADLDEQLFKNDAIARRDMEQAQTDAVSAEADLEAARQQLVALGADSTDLATLEAGKLIDAKGSVIRSPLEGTLVEKLITPGQLLTAGETACFTVADVSRMWVLGNVFESDLANVDRGDSVDVTSNAYPGVTFRGHIDYVADLIDPDTRATSVRVTVPNPDHRLRKGMYVDVAIHSSREDQGILVPVSAVERDEDNRPFVFVGLGNNRFERRTVTLGERIGDTYHITAGLSSGDQVVAEGELFLQFALTQ